MNPFNCMRLVISGCDSVDRLVVRAGGTDNATALVHSMIINYLHFQDMRVERAQKNLDAARQVLSDARGQLACTVKNGAFSPTLYPMVSRIEELEHNVRSHADKVKEEQRARATEEAS